MDIEINEVQEIIKNLESGGELSIKEEKYLKIAKLCVQLAAENVEAKKIISECREYFIAWVMNRIRPTNEGYLHMICDTFADETPATDRIVAGIKADGVEMFALMFAEEAIKDNNITTGWKARASRAASEYAELLREGADK